MALKWHELSAGREYIISHDKKIHAKTIYKGTFIQRNQMRCLQLVPVEKEYPKYEYVSKWLSLFSINGNKKHFFEYDTYYDVADIKKNANQARKNMEQRALDKILKRLVNEEFKWA